MKSKLLSKLHIIAVIVLILGGVYSGIKVITGKNILKKYSGDFHTLFYVVVAVAAIYLALNRNTYLPFLGRAAFPCKSLQPYVQKKTDTVKKIKTGKPNKKIVYWAAQPGGDYTKYDMDAYADVSNYGVAYTDKDGVATIYFNNPQGYMIDHMGLMKAVDPNVHYRICEHNLLMGPVYTIPI